LIFSVCDTTWNCVSLCNCSHQFCKNIPVSFDIITTCNQGECFCVHPVYIYIYVYICIYIYIYIYIYKISLWISLQDKTYTIIYILLYVYVWLPWLMFFCAFSSAVRQMPRQNPQRRGTARTLPNFCVVLCIVCFVSLSVLFVCICVLYYCHRGGYPIAVKYISYHI